MRKALFSKEEYDKIREDLMKKPLWKRIIMSENLPPYAMPLYSREEYDQYIKEQELRKAKI